MAKSGSDKEYFTFAAGLNSDASPLTFPENFSVDESNFEILKDATRRRRRGIAKETVDGGYVPAFVTAVSVCRSFKWSDVAGNPNTNFIVIQYGTNLHFYVDSDPVDASKLSFILDLTLYLTNTSNLLILNTIPIDAAFGRGHFFVTHKLLHPFYVKYDSTTEVFTVNLIDIFERDFEGVTDGITDTAAPVSATDGHKYNLYNRGWSKADLATYLTSKSKYPSKNMVPYLGYRRVTTAGVAEEDWTKAFSPDKLVAELFQDAPAPTGHFIRNPFNTAKIALPDSVSNFAIINWTITGTTAGTQTVTVTTASAHGLVAGNTFTVAGQYALYSSTYGGGGGGGFYGLYNNFDFNGTRTVVTAPATNQLTFTVTFPDYFIAWISQYAAYGTVQSQYADNPYGYTTDNRPTCIEFYAGRLWFAGTAHEKLATRVFFSQIIEGDSQYGKCYQVADPTDQNISDLIDTDGGVIVIPEAANIHYLMAYSGSLLIFASNGIWAISGGQNGYFTATSYSVRKVSDIGSTGAGSIVLAENIPMYWSTSGIYGLIQDENSGFVSPKSLSIGKIDNFYKDILYSAKQVVQSTYDDINKQVLWLYNRDTTPTLDTLCDSVLIFNMQFAAFTPWRLGTDTGIAYTNSLFTIRDSGSSKRIKFVGITDNLTKLSIGDTSGTGYIDWGLTDDEMEAYIVTGYDTADNAQFRKYAPYITVYQNKTETGYTSSGGDLIPVGESSLLMQAQWDWTNRSNSGKWGNAQQVYRHRRLYTPVGAEDTFDDGESLVVTRNKVRGRGRALSLKYTAGTGMDSWLLGWTIRYNITGAGRFQVGDY